MIRLLTIAMAMLLLFAGAALAHTHPAHGFLNQVQVELEAGQIDAEEALLLKFHYAFDQSRLPAKYLAEGTGPMKCGTPLVIEFYENRAEFSRETVEAIEAYLAPSEESRATYQSPGGNFLLTYTTTGTDAVPATDTNPANGIPDFVEKVASYFDFSWATECETYRFQAPPIGTGQYQVSFENLSGIYGYTTIVNYSAGTTRIVMDHTFTGFPPNDDPEGDVWGAAKVTAAHEFKHATQFATSRWGEGGWNEVDATWAEEMVYDVVNDYYNYLPGESPIRQPTIPLDGGSQNTGSYEDCVWQIWMQETWGVEFIEAFWDWRRTHASQNVMLSWETILDDYGYTLAEGWAMFTAWNYGTGYRAIPGVGYPESEDYPAGNFQSYTTTYPYNYNGSVNRLAANFIRLLGLNDTMEGTVDIMFNGADVGDMTLSLHIEKIDGTGVIEVVPLDENNDATYSVMTPMEDINWMGIIPGNATLGGSTMSYTLNVVRTEALPEPVIQLDAASVAVSLEEGQTTSEIVALSNPGEPGSVLNYDIEVWGNNPVDEPGVKSVAGSTLTSNVTTYLPGTTFDIEVTVFNGSTDEEWISDVDMDFPAGVTVNTATNYVGGFYGDLVHDGSLGNGAAINWHGTVGAQQYGVIREGETAEATLNISVDPGFSGDIVIPSVIGGDTYGSNPHTLAVDVVLAQASPEVAVTYPNGGEVLFVGDSETITWDTFGTVDYVDVEISMNGGANWDYVATNIANTGSFSTTLMGGGSIHALVRVSDAGGGASDVSDAEFTVVLPVGWLAVSPMSGSLNQGQSQDLSLDFDATGLADGGHPAWIIISEDQEGLVSILPVTLSVSGGVSGVDTPAMFSMDGNYPNPFNPMTRISFRLPAEAQTTVEVLDVRGRLVRTLHRGVMGEGAHELIWNGRNDADQVVAAGMYLARLRTDGYEATTKMTLAK